MLKVGQIVKLKNPKNKREAKRRWRVIGRGHHTFNDIPVTPDTFTLRRLDTIRREVNSGLPQSLFVPISFWEKIWRRY